MKTAHQYVTAARTAVTDSYLNIAAKDLETARREITRLQAKIIGAQRAFGEGYTNTAAACLRD